MAVGSIWVFDFGVNSVSVLKIPDRVLVRSESSGQGVFGFLDRERHVERELICFWGKPSSDPRSGEREDVCVLDNVSTEIVVGKAFGKIFFSILSGSHDVSEQLALAFSIDRKPERVISDCALKGRGLREEVDERRFERSELRGREARVHLGRGHERHIVGVSDLRPVVSVSG